MMARRAVLEEDRRHVLRERDRRRTFGASRDRGEPGAKKD